MYRRFRLLPKFCLLLTLLPGSAAGAQQSDITFIVAGKTSNHRQQPDGSTRVLNYHFFAEIFLQPGGRVQPANLTTPDPDHPPLVFQDSGYALEVHGGRYPTESELEANYPDGDYLFHYSSPSTGAVSQVVKLGNPAASGSGLPTPPRIQLSQGGVQVHAGEIDPERDLQVRWSEFTTGGADPQGIMDDLLFVIMGDCHGERRAHSGRPFEDGPYLTYAATEFTIEAERLLPDNIYQLSVEHAVLDTSLEHGVVGFGTFATTTFLDIRTTGTAAEGRACREIHKPFDAGQTDRH